MSDLPLRLLAGLAVAGAVLGLAINGGEWLERQETARWARGMVDEIRGVSQQLIDRPGSSDVVRIEPPAAAHHVRVRLTLLGPGSGPLRATVEDDAGTLASTIACRACSVELAGAQGDTLLFVGAGELHFSSPAGGSLRVEGVAV